MLKSWKTRALATAGAVALAAPFAFMGGASALPIAPTGVTLSPSNGPAGTTVTVRGTGCGSTTTPATGVLITTTGPGLPSAGLVTAGTSSGGVSGDFTGTATIPGSAAAADMFSITARCTDSTGTGPASTAVMFTVMSGGLLSTGGTTLSGLAGTGGTTLSGLAGTGSTSLSGSSITSTSGQTSSSGFGTTGDLSGGTTGIAQPITATPRFTG